MEAFGLLKFWRSAGRDVPGSNCVDVRNRAPEISGGTDEEDDSFFDLVFTPPDDCTNKEVMNTDRILVNDTLKSNASEVAPNDFMESPFKSKVFPVDSNSKPQTPGPSLKSAPKFRVFLLGFKKSKPEKAYANEGSTETSKHQFRKSSDNDEQSKRFTVKCEVEEVQIASLFIRGNSLRSKMQQERSIGFPMDDSSKNLSKDVPKYLRLIRPLYIRASKRHTDNMKVSSDYISTVNTTLSSPATVPSSSPRKFSEEKRGNRAAGFRVVSKHLGKSRSTSSAVGILSSPANRRDDSLLLQNDGIQSAILHCKRSYNSSAKEYSTLFRSASDSTSINPPSNLSAEQKRCSSI